LWLSRLTNKRSAYIAGMLFWVTIQFIVFTVQPGETDKMVFLCFLLGIGLSSAYVLPDAIFPDIIEWDELRTGRRQEGIYYGARAFIRKMAGALTIFLTLQLLGWAGYQPPPEHATLYAQPDSVLKMIRLLVSPMGAILLFGAVLCAWFYPLNRKKYAKIRELLEKRKAGR
jgi:glycoside/pentoside/hexuronide:cation symporter, GPH family